MIKHHNPKLPGEERVFFLHFHISLSLREVRAEPHIVQGQEVGADAEAMKGAVYQLAPRGLLSLLPYSTQDH